MWQSEDREAQIHFYDARPDRRLDDVSHHDALCALLDEDEHAAMQRLKFPKDQYQSLCAQGLKRTRLAPLCGQAPAQLRFTRTPDGKPVLSDYPQWHFNLSHSHGLILLAVRHGVPIGIDVECLRDTLQPHELAERFFHADEARLLRGISSLSVALRQFYRFWVAKEAIIKAMGGTIAHMLSEVVLDIHENENVVIRRLPGTFPDAQNWHLEEFIPAENALAMVASPAKIDNLEFFTANLP